MLCLAVASFDALRQSVESWAKNGKDEVLGHLRGAERLWQQPCAQ